MEILTDLFALSGTLKAFFFFFGGYKMPDANFDKIIKEDGFGEKTFQQESLKIYFQELERVKLEFKKFLNSKNDFTSIDCFQIIQGFLVRLRKIRLIIEFKVYMSFNLDHRCEKYLVGRSYWITSEGKMVKKFAKVIGKESDLKINNKFPSHITKKLEDDLREMMWLTYSKEYKS